HTRFSRDWSSDVCSSDLRPHRDGVEGCGLATGPVKIRYLPDGQMAAGRAGRKSRLSRQAAAVDSSLSVAYAATTAATSESTMMRSEERRVGKECRAGGPW